MLQHVEEPKCFIIWGSISKPLPSHSCFPSWFLCVALRVQKLFSNHLWIFLSRWYDRQDSTTKWFPPHVRSFMLLLLFINRMKSCAFDASSVGDGCPLNVAWIAAHMHDLPFFFCLHWSWEALLSGKLSKATTPNPPGSGCAARTATT